MKRVVSVSIGSSKRDHKVETEFLGEKLILERIGTDGSMEKAIELIKQLDGNVAAIGLGGIDLYFYAGNRRYTIKDALKLKEAAKKTPVVDGSGLKNTLERRAIEYLQKHTDIVKKGKKVLLVSAVDRFGMAETLYFAGCDCIFGDLIFGLGIPIPIKSMRSVSIIAAILLPIITRMPFEKIYPTGKNQETIEPKYTKYYDWAEIIAGDFHLVRKNMPPKMTGKIIITNTVTQEDVALLKERGIDTLITTTPEMQGRSFGTNVLEAMLVALLNKQQQDIKPEDYLNLLTKLDIKIRIEKLA